MGSPSELVATLGREIVPIRFGAAPGHEPDIATLGFKGYNLWRMARLGLPVPQAIVIGTGYCREYLASPHGLPVHLETALTAQLGSLELATGLKFGSARKPLLVSVRSGAPVSMPGMMETVLNVGLTDSTVPGLLRLTGNPRLVWDSYRRLVQSFAEVVYGCSPAPFEEMLRQHLRRADAESARSLDFRALQELARGALGIFESQTGRPFPQKPLDQLNAAIESVFASWNGNKAREYRRLNQIDASTGTAVTVQRMVYGNAGGTSGSGVAFTRDPSTGAPALYVDFLFNAQGEDVVSGRQSAEDLDALAALLPDSAEELSRVAQTLEREFRDMQEFEFTIQDGRLFLLQTRTAKRTAWAALRSAIDLVDESLIDPTTALQRLCTLDLDRIERSEVHAEAAPLARGVPAGLGVVTGRIALDAAAARRLKSAGHQVILVRDHPSTDDIAAIAAADGLLCASGGRTSHAAVVARQLDKACVVGCAALAIDSARRRCSIGATALSEGEIVSLDGASGEIYAGAVKVERIVPSDELQKVDAWRAAAAFAHDVAAATLPHD
jgi:pyruvate,orthophosphate dikinase